MTKTDFTYAAALGRDDALVSEADQRRLRTARVAVAGLGGVGGSHTEALARMGIGSFHLADLDTFEVVNFNRQIGATMDTIGRAKSAVLSELVRSINPEADVREFSEGITPENIGDFLRGVDLVMDGLEFFAIDVRRMLYAACRKRRIPVVHAGPMGYGATLFVFMPDGPSFDEHFRIDDEMTRAEMLAAHVAGHARGGRSDVDVKRVDFAKRTGPALISACLLCSAFASTEALKVLTGRPNIAAAPRGVYIDPYRSQTRSIKPCPSLTKSWRGRFVRWLIFRKIPGLRLMHEDEIRRRSRRTSTSYPDLAATSN